MNIQVRKIGNGYIISYPKIVIPKKGEKEPATYTDKQDTFSGYFFISAGPTQPSEERIEWYCATQKQVEEAVPRIALECYQAMRLKEEA